MQDLFEELKHTPGDIVEHLQRLHDLVIEKNAKVVVELGVARGASTAALLAAAEETGAQVWSVDYVVPDEGLFDGLEGHSQWTFVVENDLDVIDACPEPIDVLFIDSAHDYTQTLAELESYVPKVRAGGCVVMHDVAHVPDIFRAVQAYWGDLGVGSEFYNNCYGLYVRHL